MSSKDRTSLHFSALLVGIALTSLALFRPGNLMQISLLSAALTYVVLVATIELLWRYRNSGGFRGWLSSRAIPVVATLFLVVSRLLSPPADLWGWFGFSSLLLIPLWTLPGRTEKPVHEQRP